MNNQIPLDLSDLGEVQVGPAQSGAGLSLEALHSAHGIEEMAASCSPVCSCCIACCCCCPSC
ncbi:hypothetical protein WEH80_10780 [Actinomycetes bacterium KLBMP 9759]